MSYERNMNLFLPFEGPPELVSHKTLAQKAADYYDLLKRVNLSPEGLLIYTTKVGNEPESPLEEDYQKKYHYGYKSDAPFIAGLNLAMLGYKFAVTKDMDTLEVLKRFLKGFEMLGKASGVPGLWVRDIIPVEGFVPGECHGIWVPSPVYKHYMMRIDVSRDQYHGVLYGIGVLWRTVFDPAVRRILKNLIRECADFLMKNNYQIIDIFGKPTKHSMMWGWYGPVPVRTGAASLAIIKLAAVMTFQEKYQKEYRRLCKFPKNYYFASTRGFYDFTWFNRTNCNNQNMSYMSLYTLAGHETDPDLLPGYISAMLRQSRFTDSFTNPFWMYAQMAFWNKDQDKINDCMLMLNSFPDQKIWTPYSHSGRNDVERTFFRSRLGYPTSKRAVPSNWTISGFLWTNDTRGLRDVTKTGYRDSPIDYLLAYWMGRYYGFLQDNL